MQAYRSMVFVSALLGTCLAASAALADASAFVGTVGFDSKAHLDRGLGFGLRWGRSGRIFGGETALMIARPERKLGAFGQQTATALFYEGRLLVGVPLGSWRPFAGIGLGAVTITSTSVPESQDEAVAAALKAVSDLQTSMALSYGAGVRYALNGRLNLRADWRQYVVLDVTSMALDRAAEHAGLDLPDDIIDDKTVQHNELSFGIQFVF